LPPGMALGCRLTSVRGDRGENYDKRTTGLAENILRKKNVLGGPNQQDPLDFLCCLIKLFILIYSFTN
jgi:hypothetical protein